MGRSFSTRYAVAAAVIVPLAALRVARLITTDRLTERVLWSPLRRRAISHQTPEQFRQVQQWEAGQRVNAPPYRSVSEAVVEGADCPYCLPFWAGLVLIVATVAMPRPARKWWLALLAALGMNYAVGFVSSRLD